MICAAEKHLVSEKPLIQRFFKGTGVVLAGIECSPKISDFRANGIPVGERVDFFDTLTAEISFGSCFFKNGLLFYHSGNFGGEIVNTLFNALALFKANE